MAAMWRAALLVGLLGGCFGTPHPRPRPRLAATTTVQIGGAAGHTNHAAAHAVSPPRLEHTPTAIEAQLAQEAGGVPPRPPPPSPAAPPSEADRMRAAELKRLDATPDQPALASSADPAITAALAALDPSEYARWPLTPNVHPALEPAFAIADVFGEPGVSWLDLCAAGAQNRRISGRADELAYLRAWCAVARHDAAAAIELLAPLRSSSVRGIAGAVRRDIANIAVDAGDAERSLALLRNARLDDVPLYDLVAAGYAEVGKPRDAVTVNALAIDAHDVAHRGDHCMRLVRPAVLAAPDARAWHIDALLPECPALYHELVCWTLKQCDAYLFDRGIKPESLALGWVYADRPKHDATAADWLIYARRLARYTASGSVVPALDAFEHAVRAVRCTGETADEVRLEMKDFEVPDPLRLRRDVLAFAPEQLCR